MLDKTTTPFTTDALIQWLRKQRADEEYIWSDPVFCMMGRYLADHGSTWGAYSYSDMPGYHEIAAKKPWTYGAALERAKALQQLPAPPLQIPSPPQPSPLQIEHDRSHALVPVA